MAPKIALVAGKKEDVDTYLKNLQDYDAEIKVCESFKELECCLAIESYNGIIVDLRTKLSVPRDQKVLAYDLLEHYPVLQSRIIPDSGRLQTMPFGKAQRDVSMEVFLSEECPNFAARKIRSAIRRTIHFNVVLSKSGNFTANEVEKTVTLNVSRDGCYILSTQQFEDRSSVAFIIKELKHRTPIVGEIRWVIPWGKTMRIPGIGVKFEDIHRDQLAEMVEKYDLM